MTDKTKPEIWWCVLDMHNNYLPHTSSKTKAEAIWMLEHRSSGIITWEQLKECGYKVVKIEVRRVK